MKSGSAHFLDPKTIHSIVLPAHHLLKIANLYSLNPTTYLIPTKEPIGWVPCSARQMQTYLCTQGLSLQSIGGKQSEVSLAMLYISQNRRVDAVTEMAGRVSGYYEENRRKFLINSGPELVRADPAARHPIISGLIDSMFAPSAVPTVMSWLALSVRSLQSGHYVPGQVLVLMGPPKVGKSLFVSQVIVPLLGGRSASISQIASGGTRFNQDHIRAEVLIDDDELHATSSGARLRLERIIKNYIFSDRVRIEGKGTNAIYARPWWRMIFCLNDESDMRVLPSLDCGLEDKISIFYCSKADLPFRPSVPEERQKLRELIGKELGAFVHTLVTYRIPEEIKDDRCGVKAYLDPDFRVKYQIRSSASIVDSLCALLRNTPEIVLPANTRLRASDIFEALHSQYPAELQEIAQNPTGLGSLLAKLASERRCVVRNGVRDGYNCYMIQR